MQLTTLQDKTQIEQPEVCPMCKTKNHSLMFICLLLKEVKCHEKDYKGYRFNDPSLNPSKKMCQIKDGVRNVQVTPIGALFIPVFNQIGHVYHQNKTFDNEFSCGKNTPEHNK